MDNPKPTPLLFGLLAALILLAGGTAVGLAAHWVVAPQTGETVEVDTPAIPSILGQSVDEVVFYPWNIYEGESFESNLSESDQQARMEWYLYHLVQIPQALGFSGMETSLDKAQVRTHVGYWTDCPVTNQSGLPALLDVAFGKDSQNFGMSWVACSTGELPTRAQKEAAADTVQQDVCRMFTTGEDTALERLLVQVWECLGLGVTQATGTHLGTPLEYYAQDTMENVLAPVEQVGKLVPVVGEQNTQQQLEAISSAAQAMDYSVQLVTTQRQVVLVITRVAADIDCWWSVGVYYDMVLEQYSGIVLNNNSGYGF